jgi:uncharacterized protein (TIGR00251 family)
MKRNFEITDASGGAAFNVRVVTRATKAEVAGIQDDGVLKVRLTNAPDDGANEELIGLLAKVLNVDASALEIVAGEKGRDKLISVDGIAPEVLEERLLSIVDES